jgi:hypothetical protein
LAATLPDRLKQLLDGTNADTRLSLKPSAKNILTAMDENGKEIRSMELLDVTRSGEEMTLLFDPNYLTDALKLGFLTLHFFAPHKPIIATRGSDLYLWMPCVEESTAPAAKAMFFALLWHPLFPKARKPPPVPLVGCSCGTVRSLVWHSILTVAPVKAVSGAECETGRGLKGGVSYAKKTRDRDSLLPVEGAPHSLPGGMTMKARPYRHNAFKEAVIRVIRSTAIDAERTRLASESLRPQDRDCLRYYVPRLLALERF